MKKTLKSILAITLTLIMSFGTLTAFAASDGTLEWYFDDYLTEYTLKGELAENANPVTCGADEELFLGYTLNAKDGYYLISYSYSFLGSANIGWIGIPDEITDGVAHDTAYPVFASDLTDEDGNGYCEMIYKLEAGETYVGVDIYNYGTESVSSEFYVEFLGESITDYEIQTKEFISNYDVYLGETEGGVYTDVTVTFSSGKTKTIEYWEMYYTCEEEITAGENVLTFELEGLEKDFTVTVKNIDDYIISAELANAENYTSVQKDYDGSLWYYGVNGEAVTITFADSTQKDVFIYEGYGSVELPNGNVYPIYTYIDWDYDDNLVLYIDICNDTINQYECSVENFSVIENGAILIEDNKSEFRNFFSDIYWGLDDALMYHSLAEIFRSLFGTSFDTLIGTSNLFSDLFENIITFIKFYLVG